MYMADKFRIAGRDAGLHILVKKIGTGLDTIFCQSLTPWIIEILTKFFVIFFFNLISL